MKIFFIIHGFFNTSKRPLKGYSIPLIKGLLKARICPIISENNETEKNRWFRGGKKPCSKAQNCSFAKTGSETIKEVNT